MKYYLLFLLFLIMGAGARTMFEVAYHGLTKEHGLSPDRDTLNLMLLAVWYIVMMMADVILLNHRQIKHHLVLVCFLSLGVMAPTLYMILTH